MSDDLFVAIEGRLAGVVHRDRGRLTWTYDADYPMGATPLSVRIPVAGQSTSGSDLVAWLDGLLPDNERVRDSWARSHRVSNTAFDLLSTPIGRDVPGAAAFSPHPRDVTDQEGGADEVTEAEIAGLLRGMGRDSALWVAQPADGRFSLAGAQAKTALMRTADGRWCRPWGAWATSHIIKPPIPGVADHHVNEYACMRAAALLGIPTASVTLERFEDQSAVVVERYDRIWSGTHFQRVHQEDMCQALGVAPTRKYEADGGPGVRDMLGVVRAHVPPQWADDDVDTLIDAQVFNWAVAGTDAHAKNYGLLVGGTDARLAPLYDLTSGLVEWHERELKLAMRIGTTRDVWPYSSPWSHAASDWGLRIDRITRRIDAMLQQIPTAFAAVGTELQRRGWPTEVAEQLHTAVSKRTDRLAAFTR